MPLIPTYYSVLREFTRTMENQMELREGCMEGYQGINAVPLITAPSQVLLHKYLHVWCHHGELLLLGPWGLYDGNGSKTSALIRMGICGKTPDHSVYTRNRLEPISARG